MDEQNMAIVKSLVSVAWADGEFADEEREVIEALISGFEATEAEATELRAYAAEKKTLDDIPLTDLSTSDRRVLLQHAVLLSYIDGQQGETEKAFLAELCKKLRIPQAESEAVIAEAGERAKSFLHLL
jgi:tellurite resistance protein